jgi:hypothetical protein
MFHAAVSHDRLNELASFDAETQGSTPAHAAAEAGQS